MQDVSETEVLGDVPNSKKSVILIQKKEKDETLNFERDVEGRNHVWVHPCTLGGSNTKIIYSVY